MSVKLNDPYKRAHEVLTDANIKTVPVPVEKIAKLLGAEVRFSVLDNELSGMIFIKDGTPIIGVNALHHPNRQRYTIAHELGHLIMHKEAITSSVHVDKTFQTSPVLPVLKRDGLASAGVDDMEIEANRFASALLMPREVIEEALKEITLDIDDDRPLEQLAKRFKVSRQALEFRIRNLQSKL